MDRPDWRLTVRGLAAAAAVVATLVATACTGESDDASTGDGDAPPDQVTYLTGFGAFGREAYAYVALEKGYFAEENIEVEIQPGSGTLPNMVQVVEGGADFALGDFTGMLLSWANEEVPRDFTVVSAVQQQTLFAFLALEESGIQTPQDLEGKAIADAAGSFGQLLFPAYADAVGIDADQVEYNNSFEPQNLPQLLATGDAEVVAQFVVGEPTFEAVAEGRNVVVLPFSDVFRDLFGISLAVSTSMAEENPDLVQRFNRALMRGLEDTIANPQEAGEILAEYNPEGPPAEVNTQEIVLMEPYVQPVDPGAPLGSVDPERVQKSIGILQSAGAIPEGMTPEDIVTFSLTPGFEES